MWTSVLVNNNQRSREIILVVDDDDIVYEANHVIVETGECSRATGGG